VSADRWKSAAELKELGYDQDTIARIEIRQELHADAQLLLTRIDKAFGEIPRPLITLHVARGYDDEWSLSQERGEELRAMDPETDWREVSGEKLRNFTEYFSFSNPEGWLFYLPAFMSDELRDFPFDCHGAALTFLNPRDPKAALLNNEQMGCLEAYLNLDGLADSEELYY